MSSQPKHDPESLFQGLVESAFEFLNAAINQLEESPKFSTVNFAASIELFLKARLLKEHWALVIDKPDNASRSKFFNGSSKTVAPDAAFKRLRDIVCDPVPEEAEKTFRAIAEHRNRMMHFVHGSSINEQASEAELEYVVAEQLNGWCHIQGLLSGAWSEHFKIFETKVFEASHKMTRHRGYLEAKFSQLSQEISKLEGNGEPCKVCPSCGFKSVVNEHLGGAISTSTCLLCQYTGHYVTLECPSDDCTQKIEFSSYEGPPEDCPSCGSPFYESVSDLLNTGEAITKDNIYDFVDINCPQCMGYHTVVRHYEGYVCTSCFEYSDTMETCEWCSEGQLGGVPEFSQLSGCDFCDGKLGWDKD